MDTALAPHSQHPVAWLSVDSVAGPVVLVWLFGVWGGNKKKLMLRKLEDCLRFLNL